MCTNKGGNKKKSQARVLWETLIFPLCFPLVIFRIISGSSNQSVFERSFAKATDLVI